MKCIYKTAKMCFVFIAQHIWLFLGQKSCFSDPLSAQLQSIKISDFYIVYTPSVVKPKSELEISGMCTYFRVVMETCFE